MHACCVGKAHPRYNQDEMLENVSRSLLRSSSNRNIAAVLKQIEIHQPFCSVSGHAARPWGSKYLI